MTNSLCRLCSSKDQIVNVFHSQLENGEQLRFYILLATGIKIKQTDVISKMVCHRCCEIAVKLHRYRTNAVMNDRVLKEKYGQPYTPPIIDQAELLRAASRICNGSSSGDLETSISKDALELLNVSIKKEIIDEATDIAATGPLNPVNNQEEPVHIQNNTSFQVNSVMCVQKDVKSTRVRENTVVTPALTGVMPKPTVMQQVSTSSNPVVQSSFPSLPINKVPKYVHPSIYKICKQYKNIILPLEVLKADISPDISLDKDEVNDWYEEYYNALKKKLRHVVIKKVPNSSNYQISTVSNKSSEKCVPLSESSNSHNSKRQNYRRILDSNNHDEYQPPDSADLGSSITPFYIMKPIDQNITNTSHTISRPIHRAKKRTGKKPHSVRKRSSSKDSDTAEVIPQKKKRIYSNKNALSTLNKVDLPKDCPANKHEQKAIFTSSLELTPTEPLPDIDAQNIMATGKTLQVFMCSICSVPCDSKKELFDHEKKHLTCKYCKKKIRSMALMMKHLSDSCPIRLVKDDAIVKLTPVDSEAAIVKKYPEAFRNSETSLSLYCGEVVNFKEFGINIEETEPPMVYNGPSDNYEQSAYVNAVSVQPTPTYIGNISTTVLENASTAVENISTAVEYTSKAVENTPTAAENTSTAAENTSTITPNVDEDVTVVTFEQNSNTNDVVCISDDSDVEIECTVVPKHTIVEQAKADSAAAMETETINPAVKPQEPKIDFYSLSTKTNLSEKDMIRSLFKKYSQSIVKRSNKTQTFSPSGSNIKYTDTNLIILKDMYPELLEYKIPVQLESQPKISARFKEGVSTPKTPSTLECWVHKPPIDVKIPVSPYGMTITKPVTSYTKNIILKPTSNIVNRNTSSKLLTTATLPTAKVVKSNVVNQNTSSKPVKTAVATQNNSLIALTTPSTGNVVNQSVSSSASAKPSTTNSAKQTTVIKSGTILSKPLNPKPSSATTASSGLKQVTRVSVCSANITLTTMAPTFNNSTMSATPATLSLSNAVLISPTTNTSVSLPGIPNTSQCTLYNNSNSVQSTNLMQIVQSTNAAIVPLQYQVPSVSQTNLNSQPSSVIFSPPAVAYPTTVISSNNGLVTRPQDLYQQSEPIYHISSNVTNVNKIILLANSVQQTPLQPSNALYETSYLNTNYVPTPPPYPQNVQIEEISDTRQELTPNTTKQQVVNTNQQLVTSNTNQPLVTINKIVQPVSNQNMLRVKNISELTKKF